MSKIDNAYRKALTLDALRNQGGRCKYCKGLLSEDSATADHFLARSRRGATSQKNIVAACLSCNDAKADLHHNNFYALIERKVPKHKTPPAILLIWASRKIYWRTQRACKRIERAAR